MVNRPEPRRGTAGIWCSFGRTHLISPFIHMKKKNYNKKNNEPQ